MERNYLSLDSLDSYRVSLELSNYIWNVVIVWEWFPKKTVGVQIVTSADSIAADIAEGFGRYHKKDKIKFYRYAQGSLSEVKNWVKKCEHRKLMKEQQITFVNDKLEYLGPAINRLIKFTNDKLKF